MDRVVTQTRSRAFETLGRIFYFLLRLQKLGRVFRKLDGVFERPSHAVVLQSWFNNQYLKKKNSQRKKQIYTVADWDNMGRVITQTRARTFQTLTRAFRTLGRAFGFLLNPQKLGQVFQKLSWVFQRLDHMFWNKCLAESFDERTH